MLYGDVNLINNEIKIYESITREEIQAVAKKYLNPKTLISLKKIIHLHYPHNPINLEFEFLLNL